MPSDNNGEVERRCCLLWGPESLLTVNLLKAMHTLDASAI